MPVATIEQDFLVHEEFADIEQLSAMQMLEAKWDEGKFLCVGLDVVADSEVTLYEKARMIVEATHDIAAAYKPNDAFYAALGSDGVKQMEELVGYIKELAPDTLVIWDAKRGDIENTNSGYNNQRNFLGAEGITVHPYLGGKAVGPLLADPDSIGFVLGHTSNPGAGEFQHLRLQSGELLWERVVSNVANSDDWEHGAAKGIVLGATYPEELAKARYLAGEEAVFLVPGVGTQGGDAKKAVEGAMNSNGTGFVISVSSGISKAKNGNGKVTAKSIRSAAIKFHEEIHTAWKEARAENKPSFAERMFTEFDRKLGAVLLEQECLQFGEFTLKSGMSSPVYMNLRSSITDPSARSAITQIYVDMVKRQEEARGREFDLITGNPQAATSYGALVADRMGRRLVQLRAGSPKEHGIVGSMVDGRFSAGEEVFLIEDLTTTAGSVMEAAEKLGSSGLKMAGVASIIDREQGGTEKLRFFNIPYTSASTMKRVVKALGEAGDIPQKQYRNTMRYLGEPVLQSRKTT
jgi:orotidine 5'-phosphate decarboxylase subfamily 2